MAQRKAALELMARQAAEGKNQAVEKEGRHKRRRRRAKGKAKAAPAELELRVGRVSTSVRTVSGGLPSLRKRR
ncbi:hypothetical protein [Streptomyces spiralis]|nr:hypothetical protein [Streptomyces spiralis]